MQVPASIRGKVQHGEYIDLSELLAYDFQYRYSRLDDSQALEIVDGKLSLAPKCKARHLSTLQLWLWAWHLYEDTFWVCIPAGTWSCHTTGVTSQVWTSTSSRQQCWAMMHSSSIDMLSKGSHSAPLTNSSMSLPSMLQPPSCWPTDASSLHFDHKVVDCPFPPGAPMEKDPASKKAAQGQPGWGNQHRHLQ